MFEGMPGAGLATTLAGTPVADLPGGGLVDFLVAAHRLVGWAQAVELAAVTELAYRRPDPGEVLGVAGPAGRGPRVSEFASAEISAALRLSRPAADRLLDLALALDALPGTRTALAAGRIDLPKVRAVIEATANLDQPGARAVENQVLSRTETQTAALLRRALARAVLRAAPDLAERQQAQAVADRRTWLEHHGDGSRVYSVHGPTHDIFRLHAAVDANARTLEPHTGTLDQRRFDALQHIADTVLDDPTLPRTRFGPPGLVLLTHPGRPAELLGAGPIPDPLAQELAAHRHTPIIPTAAPPAADCDHDRNLGYQIPDRMADQVARRDRTCQFPTCRQPAHRCDLDHTRPHPNGPTCPCNLAPLCRYHHRLKTHSGWRLQQPQPGHLRWTSPTRHVYNVHPDDDEDPPATG